MFKHRSILKHVDAFRRFESFRVISICKAESWLNENSSSTPREMRRGGPLARGVDSMDGTASGSEWVCEWCEKLNSAGRLCTGCTLSVHIGACTLPRPRPRSPEVQNSVPASAASGVASADQTAARSTEEPTCLTEEQRAPQRQRLFPQSKAGASNRILEGRTRPTRRPSRSTTRRRSRSRSRADSMIPEPPLSPEDPAFRAGPADALSSSSLPVWCPRGRRYRSSARGGRPSVGTHGTAAIEALIDLTEEFPLGSGSRDEEPPPSRRAPGPASSQPVRLPWEMLSPAWELLSPSMGLTRLGRHRAADRREPEPEPEPEPLTLRCESMRLITGACRRDPYELSPEADPPA